MAREEKKKKEEKGQSRVTIPLVSLALRTVTEMFYVACFAGFLSLVAEWGLYWFNQEQGYGPAFSRYSALAEAIFSHSSPLLNEKTILETISGWVDGFFEQARTGVNMMAHQADSNALDKTFFPIQTMMVNGFMKVYEWAPNVIMIWLFATLSWSAKMLTILAMAIPYIFILVIGIADGLSSRKIEMYKGARDSIDRLEYWIYILRASFYLVFFFYLAIPSSYSAYVFMVPMACISAFFIRQVISNFKKYG
ncbi:DUF4400 domain-containing protein [Vibrio mediterranei]|uniref:DUF4400 domain-containing protein n=1 Tax=Vibrio mediterranei TaxID=689 RepID=UPI0040697910